MPTARRTSETRQAELVEAALHIIATRGIAALNTRSLAERVGLTSGAIFRHFPTLDALYEAIAKRVEAVMESTYPPAELPAGQRLEKFVEARSTAVGKEFGILRLMTSEQFLLALPTEAAACLRGCVRKTRMFVIESIMEGQAAGTIRSDVEAAALAPIIMGTMQMLAMANAQAGSAADAENVRKALATLLEPNADAPRGRKTKKR